ncbi:hypothetical protein ACYJ1Y_12380, partial [Natrialbaceae archaeon A-gly3]
VENSFDAVERILSSVIQTQVNDGLAVETVLVEQLGHIGVNWFLAVLAPVSLDGDRDFLKAVLSDEDGEDPRTCVVFVVVTLSAAGAGTRLGQPRPFVTPHSVVNRVNKR